MTPWIAAVAGFVLGAVLVFFWRSAKIAELQAILSSERLSEEKMKNIFSLTAPEVLRSATEDLIKKNLQALNQISAGTAETVEHKKELIEKAVGDMAKRMNEYQALVQKFENERLEIYGGLKESIGQVLNTSLSARMEMAKLNKALTSSVGMQANLGQFQLEYILQQAGIKFRKQVTLEGEEGGSLRPDIIILLPDNKELIVDSKAPIQEYMLADQTQDAVQQKEHFKKLTANVREHVNKLSKKEYQRLIDSDIHFVLMFVPEGPMTAALSTDPTLLQDAQDKNVLLTSPMSIIPLIQLIAFSWQQYRLAEDAKHLGAEVETLGRYLFTFWEHIQKVQHGLEDACDGWNKAVSSWKSRMSPPLEKIKKVSGNLKDLPEPEELPKELSRLPDFS